MPTLIKSNKGVLKIRYLLFFIMALTLRVFSQDGFTNKEEAENRFENSLKEGKWIEYKDSAWKLTDLNGARYYHLVIYQKGIPVGVGRDYYLNDQLQNEYIYDNGLKNGAGKWYYRSGKLRGVGSFKENKLEGKVIWYYEGGNAKEADNYLEGKMNGPCIMFFENGKKESEVNYTSGEKNGIQKWYYKESEKLYCEVNYIEGKKNGAQKWYNDETGKMVGETIFENGERNGKDVTMFNDGKLRSECMYINGKEEGVYNLYYENGKIKREINYVNGSREGKFKTYWENGQVKRDDVYEKDKLVHGKTYNSKGEEVAYYAYEIMPEFPGGVPEIVKFIQKEIVYPVKSRKDGVSGRVLLKFVVDVDGSIADVSIVKSVSKELDEEAMRVVYKMPKWKPGSMDGENVKVYYNLPINFKL